MQSAFFLEIDPCLQAMKFMNNGPDRLKGLVDVVTTEEAIRALQLFIAFLVALSVLGIGSFWLMGGDGWQSFVLNTFLLLCTSLVVLFLLRLKRLKLAVYFCLLVYGAIFTAIAWRGSGVRGIIYPYFVLLVLAAGLFLGKKASYVYASLVALLGVGFLVAEQHGLLVNADRPVTSLAAWITFAILFFVTARLVNFAQVFVERAFSQANHELDERVRAEAEVRRLNDELELRISERTAELTASEERYRLIADNITDIVWSASLDWDMKRMYFSPAVERALGYTMSELAELPPNKLLTPSSFELASAVMGGGRIPLKKGPAQGALQKIELEVLRKDGVALWYEVGF